ncbi:MAG: HTH-type transcriptional activator RhaS [Chroococcidiopsis cubana SAG 39.79]|uniref:AraC family transcriptional regulator n=1 Tax=Chroococcidiopsis cubana SAG 39.79 TaxID=388085 RepID=A0AB37USQ4_9CYAN|nr:AraC family transcriptional regulator [Chroococcidiopsis cubana]MDZ4878242.1 HTH-type transcriptional activator RhaS [Chroococcidiopsis cubana SAG 39.79]RUT14503.1 AraC family transcriptional regulator [Chroococcidiopsis cubana SAG 39.79]
MNQKHIEREKERERETQREQSNREELVERIARAISEDGIVEPIKGLRLARFSQPGEPLYGVSESIFCITAQGSKEVFLGEYRYQYDPYNYLLSTAELPIVSRILAPSKEQPYLGVYIIIDPAVVASVMVEMGQLPPRSQSPVRAIEVSPLDATLLEVVVRLSRLLDSPDDARLLLPMISREIIYRLLSSEQGHRLRQMTVLGGHTHRISQAVEKICREFNKPMHVEELARRIGMSVSGFHHHFKQVTAMSPLQFQKQLRLQEARRLLIGEALDATTAGFRVGYDDTSHFNRDYKRLFGVPPMRDVERLRELARETDS